MQPSKVRARFVPWILAVCPDDVGVAHERGEGVWGEKSGARPRRGGRLFLGRAFTLLKQGVNEIATFFVAGLTFFPGIRNFLPFGVVYV